MHLDHETNFPTIPSNNGGLHKYYLPSGTQSLKYKCDIDAHFHII